MSGAEVLVVLGALAAALQIVEQGAKIIAFLSDLPEKAQQSRDTIQKYTLQVQQLVDIAKLIEQNELLQASSAVVSIVEACRQEANSLLAVLEKVTSTTSDRKSKRLWKAVSGMRKEKEILVCLDRLEREKTSLALCISTIDSKLLNSINLNLVSVETRVDEVFFKVESIHGALPAMQQAIQQLSLNNSSPSPGGRKTDFFLVPNRRVRGFIGREDILSQVDEGLKCGSAPSIVVLRGMGGQGKTQIALEYCQRASKAHFPTVFWVDATSESSLKTSFEAIAEEIKSVRAVLSSTSERISLVLKSLSNWPCPWLMILDNHDNPVEFDNLQDYIPTSDHGSILITTRHADVDALGKNGQAIELLGLSEDEALQLLFRQSMRQGDDQEIDASKAIVERLGYHPLAITQAGAYITKRKLPLKDFLGHYNRRRKLVLEQTPQMSQYRRKLGDADKETSLTVFTTWELSFEQLKATGSNGKTSAELLGLFAFLNWQNISENLFEAYCTDNHVQADCMLSFVSEFKGSWNRDLFLDVLSELRSLSLLQSLAEEPDGYYHFSLHPLVKDWIRLRTDVPSCREHSLLAASLASRLIEFLCQDGHIKMPLSAKREVLSHIAAHAENYNDFLLSAPLSEAFKFELSRVESWLATLLEVHGSYREAESMIRRVIKRSKPVVGLERVETLAHMNSLGVLLRLQQKLEEAEVVNRQVLDLYTKILGPEHVDTMISMNNLAATLGDQKKHQEAEEIHRRDYLLKKRVIGPEHPETLTTMSNLALTLKELGQLEESESLNRDALRIREKVLGSEHPCTLQSMHNLSLLLQRRDGGDEQAEALQRHLIPLSVKVLGPEHPNTLASMHGLAVFLTNQRKFDEASVYYEESIRGMKKRSGLDHVMTKRYLENYRIMFILAYEKDLPSPYEV